MGLSQEGVGSLVGDSPLAGELPPSSGPHCWCRAMAWGAGAWRALGPASCPGLAWQSQDHCPASPSSLLPRDCALSMGPVPCPCPGLPACWPLQGGRSGCSRQGPAADPACTPEPAPLCHLSAAGEKPALAECLLRTESYLKHASNCPHRKTSLRCAAPLHARQNVPEVTRTNAF